MAGRRWSAGRVLKLVRRVHLYTGLLFFPWAIFFGLSGLLFNHPNVGVDVQAVRLDAQQLAEAAGLQPWQPKQMAAELLEQLNASSGSELAVDDSFPEELSGVGVFSAAGQDGRHTVLLDMQGGMAIVSTRKARSLADPPPFAGRVVHLPERSVSELESSIARLLTHTQRPFQGKVVAHPKISQQLRFRVKEPNGRLWNATYDLRTGRLQGRDARSWPEVGVTQWVAKLHTAHHFPVRPGWMTVWVAFEDLLGIVLALWGVSGLFMWWQMKPTRRIGAACVAAAMLLAVAAFVGTSREVMFGAVAPAMGPGD